MLRANVLQLLVFVFVLLSETLYGQDSREPAAKMDVLFKAMPLSERKILVTEYVNVMTSSFLDAHEKEKIKTAFQDLQDLHVSVIPELQGFVKSVNCFYQRGEKQNMMVWLDGLRKVLSASEHRREQVKNYLESTIQLACSQLLFLYKTHKWFVAGKLEWHQTSPLSITFHDADLMCCTTNDTIRISGTSGVYHPGKNLLSAHGGKVKWRNPAVMYAKLKNYEVDMRTAGYRADSAMFYYDSIYPVPLSGQVRDQVVRLGRGKQPVFPEFSSYATDIALDSLYKDLSYRGGITYAGTYFYGTGSAEHPAVLSVVPHDSIRMCLSSRRFLFDSLRVLSDQAAMEIILDSGSIRHANINFLYTPSRRAVSVKRISDHSLHSPFMDTYHGILFNTEEIYWPLDSNFMEMRMSSRSGLFQATIESMNYFSDALYDNMQGLDEIHPLNGLLKYSQRIGRMVFTVSEYAGFVMKPTDQLRKQMILLSYSDFVSYDEYRDEITLKPRLFHYTQARVGKQDYDNIRFTSSPGKARVCAYLDTRNYNLKITGVEKITISEPRDVSVEPADKWVIMKKNRDMLFRGKLNTGMLDMYGESYFFCYDKYTISLTDIDSTYIYGGRREDNPYDKRISSRIHHVTGEIIIDKPDNKSGRKEYPGFPVLNTTETSYVYFDDPSIQDGKYRQEHFYFKLDPYSLENSENTFDSGYSFAGTLVSGIVAPVKDTLRLQPDNTFSLSYRLPDSGLELYDKGRCYGDMTLDQNGLMVRGQIYLNKSRFYSDSILLLPQEMCATAQDITVEGIAGSRPDARGGGGIIYYPADGKLCVTGTSGNPFNIYNNQIRHWGVLSVYDQALNASGVFEFNGARFSSGLFRMNADAISADSTSVCISSAVNKDISLNVSDAKSFIDMQNYKADFINNMDTSRLEFASGSRFACIFKRFTWHISEDLVKIGIEDRLLSDVLRTEDADDLPENGRNIFMTINPATDSLAFIAPQAVYNLKNGDILCKAVNHIDLTDGRFFPGNGEVYIHANGEIREFSNGRLLCGRAENSNMLTGVKLRVNRRNLFSGSGYFHYVTEEQDTSNIYFGQLSADTSHAIRAVASISASRPLQLNRGLNFKGNIIMNSRYKNLYFSGYTGLTTDSLSAVPAWVRVDSRLSSHNIQIPLGTENMNDKKQRIYNGIYINTDNVFRPYAAFLSKRLFYDDDLLVEGCGLFEWNAPMKQYIISDSLRSKYYHFRYDPGDSTISATSLINIDLKIPEIYQRIAGNIDYDIRHKHLKITNALYLAEFPLQSRLESVIVKDFTARKLKTISWGNSFCEKFCEIYRQYNHGDIRNMFSAQHHQFPDSVNKLFVFDSLNLVWNNHTHSYVANGAVNMMMVKGKPVGKKIRMKMELVRSRTGNQYFMYMEDGNIWYYFEYADGKLYTSSSNAEYNNDIGTGKQQKKETKNHSSETSFAVTFCPEERKEAFLNRIDKL